MDKLRYEKYDSTVNSEPFSLYINVEKDPYNCANEQNWHENIEIQICTSGKGTVLLDGEKYYVEKDDILVVNSNVIHYTFTDSHLDYTCLIISTAWCKHMNIIYDQLRFTPYIKSTKLKSYFEKLTDIYRGTQDPLRIAKLNSILLRIMIELAQNYSINDDNYKSKSKHFDIVKSAITYIQNNYNQKLSLEQIPNSIFFDKYSLCKEFKKHTGQTIFEYVNQHRCAKAIDYLSNGCTVYETANLCGFDNLSYFIKTFKKYTGKTPSKYKSTKD